MILPRVRFSVQQIMVAVLLTGFALAALRGPSPFWSVASFHLAIVLLSAAPVVAWARRDRGRFLWAAFAAAGWVRLLFWWLIRGVADLSALAPWQPLLWQVRHAFTPPPSLTGMGHTEFLLTCTYLDAVLAGLFAAVVCRSAMGSGGLPDRREGGAVA
jgi:hypothetical protein